ncbi:MAG: hypothetical protein HY688_04225 [Chloroflexi bacterium]|nr:hypothetical protein [Chloroflexota bacterium]
MTARGEASPEGPRPRRPRSLRGFYARAISEAERELMEHAAEVEGLDEEIALLRTKLGQALVERPEDMDLLFKGVNLLVRAVSARYRLSGEAKRDLFDNLVGTLNGIGEQLFPERTSDGDAA